MKEKKFSLHISPWLKIAALMILCDIVAVIASYFFALWIRFDCVYSRIPEEYLTPYLQYILFHAAVSIVMVHSSPENVSRISWLIAELPIR